jgi:hypothetical protein
MPAAGFNAPSILFLSTWDQPERDFMHVLSQRLLADPKRRFVRIVEPCAGAFVMPSVHRQAGWRGEQIETSDVSLYTSLVGFAVTGQKLDPLEVTIDGKPVPLTGNPIDDAALVLFEQLRLRMEKRAQVFYWNEIRRDLRLRREDHVAQIARYLRELEQRFRGMKYEVIDMWKHAERWAGDERTVISINPPTYRGGFEKFFDTGNRLQWKEPSYEVFDAEVDQFKLAERAAGWKALLLCQQQQEPGKGCAGIVHARDLSRGQCVYVWTNQQPYVEEVMGLSAVPRSGTLMTPLPYAVVGYEDDFAEGSRCEVLQITSATSRFYKDLYLHKLDFKQAAHEFAVFVDGKLAGLAGYDTSALDRPYNDKWAEALIMTYAVGVPNVAWRTTRLTTLLMLSRSVVDAVVNPWAAVRAKKMVTVEYTKHPEAKGLRGVMKLIERAKDKAYGNKLIYAAPIEKRTIAETYELWWKQEARWRSERSKAKDALKSSRTSATA